MSDGTGSGQGKYIESPTLYLYRGKSYTFNYSGFEGATHPFYLSSDSGSQWEAGSKTGEYTTGVTAENNRFIFSVPSDAPNVLYYHCASHEGMGGRIEIYNVGEVLILQNLSETDNEKVYGCEVAKNSNHDAEWHSANEAGLRVTTERFGRVTGKLQDSNGEFVQGWLEVFDEHWDWVDVWRFGGWSFDEKGKTYSLDLPGGAYKILFHPDQSEYADSFYGGATDFESATLIRVMNNRVTRDIDFSLTKQPVGDVTGIVTDATSGKYISNDIELQAYKVDENGKPINGWPDYHIWLGGNEINSETGVYTVKLPVGGYIIRMKVWEGYKEEGEESIPYDTVYYNGVTGKADASVVTVVESQSTSEINFSMTRAKFATISGNITNENDQLLSGWAHVELFSVPSEGRITGENLWDYFTEPIEMSYDQASGAYKLKLSTGKYICKCGR